MAQAFFDLSLIDGENGFIINGQQDNELLGSSVSQLGDINNDGINDLIIGAPRRDNTEDCPFTGAAYVVFGQNEFSTNFELSALDGSNGFILQGVDSEDGTGSSVSDAGDVNGDGIADLIIGAPSAGEIVEDLYGDLVNDRRGASYLFFGKDSGFDSIVDLADLDGSNGVLLSGINSGDRLGKSVSGVGDFNRDGFDDVIIGAPNYYYQDEYGGNSYLIFGQSEFSADIDLTTIDGSNGFVIRGVDAGDTSGFSVSGAGDVNGDGFDDVIIGAPDADPVESEGYYNTTEGASYVVFGGTEVGSDGSFELANLDGSNGFAINGEDVNNSFPESSGFSVSGAGDINGDGFDDLIIGAAYAGPHHRNFNATYVVFGQAEAFNPSLDVSALDGSNGFTIDSLSGISVSGAGDINGDGFDDLILGHFNIYSDTYSQSPFVLFGKSEEFAPVLTDSDFDGNQGFIPALSSEADGRNLYGDSVSEAGDINNDGVDDLIIGSSHTNSSYVIFGQADGFAPQLDLDNREPGNSSTAYFSDSPIPIVGVNLTLSDPDSPNISSARVTITNLLDGEAEVLTVDTSNTNITASYDRQTGTLSLTGTDAIANYEQVLQTVTYNNSADSPHSEARIIEFVITDDAETPKESAVATTTLNLQGGFNIADLDGSNGFVINGIQPFGRSGSSVSSAGDFNGDGIDDVIVGAKFVSSNGDVSGQSYVVFGSSNQFAADFNLDDLNGSNGFALNGLPGDRSGSSVSSAGDVNGDGFSDIIIGAYTGGDNQQGKSYVVFGAESGFAAEFDLSSLDGNNGFAISGFESNLGKSVSGAGDINNDGFDDIIVGSSEKSAVVFGAESGFAAEFDLSSLDGNNGFTFLSNSFSRSVSEAGDVNGDGIDDLIIGAPDANPVENEGSYNPTEGASYVVFGSENGFSAEFDLSLLDGSNGFVLNGVETNRDLGSSVSSAGDINADGIDDLIIRASESSYVIFGSATGFNANFDLTTIDGSNGFIINGLSQYDFSGSSVDGAGDINNDGIDDVIVGSLGDGRENYVIFGSNNGFSPSLNVNTIDSSQGLILKGIDEYESFGESVSGAGDINNDGVDDVIIGAESGNVQPDLTFAGKSYVLYGNAYLTLDLNGSNADTDFNTIFEGETIAIVDSGLTVESTESSQIASATIEIVNLLDGDREILTADTGNTAITSHYDSANGILSLNGMDTIANYQQVLRTVSYNNRAENPDTEPRRIEFVINSGDAPSSKSAFAATTVRMFNHNPTVSNPINNHTINQDEELSLTLADNTFSDEDRDELTLTATLANGNPLPDWLEFDAHTATFSGTPTAENLGSITIEVAANDGNGGIARETFELSVNAFEPSAIMQNDHQIFALSGTNEQVSLQFNLIESKANYINEIAVFVVDDERGTIDGIAPEQTGYLEAAIDKAEVVFSALPETVFPDLIATRQLSFNSQEHLGFLLVSNSTVDTVMANLAVGQTLPNVFFTTSTGNTDNFDHSQISELDNNGFTLSWEDLVNGGDADFDDLVLEVQISDRALSSVTGLQGKPERELLDLRDQTGMVEVEFTTFTSANYDNSVGLYVIENEQGAIRDSLTGQLIAPDAPSYAQTAIRQRLDLVLNRNTENMAVQLEGGVILAPYIIADGTPEQFLATNPNNQSGAGSLAYFAYVGTNPDRVDHLRLLGDNTFGFEDLYGGGDIDYNDFVFQIDGNFTL